MDDTTSLLLSMFLSTVGFAIFWYGRKQRRVPQLGVGLLMMVFPYFMPEAWMTAVVGALLAVGLYVLIRLGL